jgi:ankyrin repeat protein
MKNRVIILVVLVCISIIQSYGQYDDINTNTKVDKSEHSLYSDDGKTLKLCTAIINNDISKVKSIIEKGTNINGHRGGFFCFPLYFAVTGKHTEMVDLLLRHGAKSYECPGNHKDKEVEGDRLVDITKHLTPLYYAIKLNQLEMVKMFGENGCDLNGLTTYSYSETIDDLKSDYAKKYGHDFKKITRTKFTYPVISAAEFGNTDIFNFLIGRGVNVNVKSSEGKSTLMASASANNIEITNRLLQMGCSVNDTSNTGYTPLMFAAEVPGINFEIINSLITKGANLNHTNSKNQSAFSLACFNFNHELALFLIEHGAKGLDSKSEYESNARMENFLGDYYLAKGILDSTKECFSKSKIFYNVAISFMKKELSRVNTQKAGQILAAAMVSAVSDIASTYTNTYQVQGWQSMGFTNSQAHLMTYSYENAQKNLKSMNSIFYKKYPVIFDNYRLPPGASLDTQKSFYKHKIQQFEMSISLIDAKLVCIEKGLKGDVLNSCIEGIQLSDK